MLPRVDDVKFQALGIQRAHLQEVVQVDFALRLEAALAQAEESAKNIREHHDQFEAQAEREIAQLRSALRLVRPFFTDGGEMAKILDSLKEPK